MCYFYNTVVRYAKNPYQVIAIPTSFIPVSVFTWTFFFFFFPKSEHNVKMRHTNMYTEVQHGERLTLLFEKSENHTGDASLKLYLTSLPHFVFFITVWSRQIQFHQLGSWTCCSVTESQGSKLIITRPAWERERAWYLSYTHTHTHIFFHVSS